MPPGRSRRECGFGFAALPPNALAPLTIGEASGCQRKPEKRKVSPMRADGGNERSGFNAAAGTYRVMYLGAMRSGSSHRTVFWRDSSLGSCEHYASAVDRRRAHHATRGLFNKDSQSRRKDGTTTGIRLTATMADDA